MTNEEKYIEGLWEKHEKYSLGLGLLYKQDFRTALKQALSDQRKACAKAFTNHYTGYSICEYEEIILNAEVSN